MKRLAEIHTKEYAARSRHNGGSYGLTLLAGLLFVFLFTAVSRADTVSFTAPGSHTWTVPAGVTTITVEAWGGGGAGGGVTGYAAGGGGGAGGQYAKKVVAVSAGDTYTVVVGAGGNGNTGNGADGEDSIFGASVVVAKGGAGGEGASQRYGLGSGEEGQPPGASAIKCMPVAMARMQAQPITTAVVVAVEQGAAATVAMPIRQRLALEPRPVAATAATAYWEAGLVRMDRLPVAVVVAPIP